MMTKDNQMMIEANANLPWTDDWFQQMVNFRKQCFWECHDINRKKEQEQQTY